MEQEQYLNSSLAPVEPRRGEIFLNPEWFKHPSLVINPSPEVIGEQPPGLVSELEDLSAEITQGVAEGFHRHGSSWSYWNGESLQDQSKHIVVLQPVFLGALPDAAQQALRRSDFDSFKRGLREHLPEHNPLSDEIGRKKMRLKPPLHPNFVNVVMVDDTSGDIRALPYDRKLTLLRMFFAKHGSFKSIIAPYRKGENSLSVDGLMLSTLEGGHPELHVEELSKRLLVFGSLTEVGGSEAIPVHHIPRERWENSRAVNGLIDLGRFLGERGLLSAPIEVEELVNDPQLAKKIIRILNYSRQAEGAFMAFAPDLPIVDSLPWTGMPVVTASGRFGSIKTELLYDDLVGVVPFFGKGSGALRVGMVPVDAWQVKGPSVEAEEFTHPLLSLSQEDPGRYLTHLTRVDAGYQADSKGEIVAPPFRGVVHIHRGFTWKNSSQVETIDADISKFPPVGCGVDLMFAMSHDAMQRAFAVWEGGGRQAAAIAFPVPDHGTNIFIPWTADERGLIPKDPFALFKEAVKRGELHFTSQVPQV